MARRARYDPLLEVCSVAPDRVESGINTFALTGKVLESPIFTPKGISRDKAAVESMGINAFALTGATVAGTYLPRVSLRLPWAMRRLGFQPALTVMVKQP